MYRSTRTRAQTAGVSNVVDENAVPSTRSILGVKRTVEANASSTTLKTDKSEKSTGKVKSTAPLQSKNVNATTTTSKKIVSTRPALSSTTLTNVRKPLGEIANKETKEVKETVRKPLARKPTQAIEEPKAKKQKLFQEAEPKVEKVKEEVPSDWDDLDAGDEYDALMVSEYVVEIFDYLRVLEDETMPNPNYMAEQNGLQWKMRDILIDWLIEVHYKFRLLPETLFLAVNIIDRFLSLRVVTLQKLQLVGLTSMFIAAKYEEVIAPSIQNFIYMADGGYTDEEILKAERYILQVLDFGLHYPNPLNFLRRCSKADNYDIQTRTLAKYLMEIALVDHRFLGYKPSLVAAAGLFMARKMLDRGEWNSNLRHYSGYTEEELKPCCDLMMDFLETPTKHEALFKKYCSKKFMKASIFVKDWVEKQNKDSE